MSDKVEEVTKDTQSLNINSNPPKPHNDDDDLPTYGPQRPAPIPGLSPPKSVEETAEELSKHPLFMTSLEDGATEENEQLAALQALAYEGTPLENAANFKEQGNECFREKKWGDAREYYGKGVAILAQEERRRQRGEKRKVKKEGTAKKGEEEWEEVEEDEETIKQERQLLETLYVNRAACHLALKNYRSCWTDCAAALRLNPKNIKAFYRSAKALLAVERVDEAEDSCRRGLELEPNNKALLEVSKEIGIVKEKIEKKRRAEEERLSKERKKKMLLKTALQARGIKTRSTGKPPDMEDARIRLTPDELDPESSLEFPTLLLYPCHAESDFIKGFNERESLEQHFGYVFPLPWDKSGEYASNTVECYMESVKGGLVKVGRKMSLLEVLSSGSVEVVDELVRVFVVPRGRAEQWVKEWKEAKAKRESK